MFLSRNNILSDLPRAPLAARGLFGSSFLSLRLWPFHGLFSFRLPRPKVCGYFKKMKKRRSNSSFAGSSWCSFFLASRDLNCLITSCLFHRRWLCCSRSGFTVPRVSNPLLQAFLYGTLYGPITVPCNLPLLLSVVAFSLSSTELIEGIFIFLVFGLGFGVPLVVLSVAAKAQKDWLIRQLKSRYRQVNIFAGILLIGIGVYDLILISQFLKIFA